MYILEYADFQLNHRNRSIKTVYTNLLAKIASFINLQTPIVDFEKIDYFCISIFSKIGLLDQFKPCTQIC